MRKGGLAEWFLKRAAGTERGTAIYGDLVELATTRSRAWFWLAYARTLLSFTWRTLIAFAITTYAYLRFRAITAAILSSMDWLFRWVPVAGNRYEPPLWWWHLTPLIVLLFGLPLLAPFFLVRFGWRDRLTQLASVFLLLSLARYSDRALVFIPVPAITAAAIVVALCLHQWRRPMLVLALTLAPQWALFYAWLYSYRPGHPRPLVIRLFRGYPSLLITILLCLWLHSWLLQRRKPTTDVQLAGAPNA